MVSEKIIQNITDCSVVTWSFTWMMPNALPFLNFDSVEYVQGEKGLKRARFSH